MPDVPSVQDELAALRAANARLREVIEATDAMLASRDAQITVLARQVESLTARVEELERRLGRDSGTSSRPPSSDSPYQKKPRDRSLRERGGRRPGRQPGAQSSTLRQVASNLASACHLPVSRAARLMAGMTGLAVSAGWMAGVRHKAAGKLEPFIGHVRHLLRQAGVLYADETPARAAGRLEYVHVACTEFLTAMHTAGRSAADIDAGQVLPGYAGTIVRDGYAGYAHLTDALHAWCGAHNLRDLRDLYAFDPAGH